jgi:microsomal dipeptidase-like Zn-dependent dipeptidase
MLRFLKENDDIAILVRSRDEILEAHECHKVGFLLGFQNSSPFEDDLNLVGAFYEMGVRVAQLTYNNSSLVGGSCYEQSDAGLTRFGRGLVRELNDTGMVIDLSHVGERTSMDAISQSLAPLVISHANPSWFYNVSRNKSDKVIHACVATRGLVGLCIYQLLLPDGAACSWADFSEMLLRLVDDIGTDHVAIGTDFCLEQPPSFIAWLRSGTWTRESEEVGVPAWPEWLARPGSFPRFAERLLKLGLSETEVRAILGENWLRLLSDVESTARL